MKKLTPRIALISILLNVFLVYIFVFKGETIQSNDDRVELVLSKENRDFALAEMRGFLESVQQINEGITNKDKQMVISAGEMSGGSVIAHAPKGMMKALPADFKAIGFSTHGLFDEIAEDAKENFDPTHTQKQLNSLLNKCIACHRSFKIGLKK